MTSPPRFPGLTRAERLRAPAHFSEIFRNGSGFRTGQILLKYTTSPEREGAPLVAFVVRRSAGSAVRRNRLRRLLREAYRMRRGAFEGALHTTGLHLVVMWTGSPQEALRPDYSRISSQLDAALARLIKKLRQTDDPAARTS